MYANIGAVADLYDLGQTSVIGQHFFVPNPAGGSNMPHFEVFSPAVRHLF